MNNKKYPAALHLHLSNLSQIPQQIPLIANIITIVIYLHTYRHHTAGNQHNHIAKFILKNDCN